MSRGPARVLLVALLAQLSVTLSIRAQDVPPHERGGRALIDALEFEPLDFEQPVLEERTMHGVSVLVLREEGLPLVDVHAYFRGGYGRLPRSDYAAASGLPALLRYGGTESRSPAEVDEVIDRHALQLAFGSGGGSITSSVNTLSEQFDTTLAVWGEMLARPRFDAGEIEAWRARQVEAVRRRSDDPGRLAVVELNRLLFGDHPVGWEMAVEDLSPERVTPERFHAVHERVVCRDNLVLGFTGDVRWTDIESEAEAFILRIPPCPGDLPDAPIPVIRRGGGVWVIPKTLEQAVVVMAHPADVRLEDDEEYFAALIGNSILGGGGFSSRMLRRVRTEEGFAYTATSLWTTPRDHEGVVGAMTGTRPEAAVPAIEVILETMRELREAPPAEAEIRTTVDQIVNGFVFNFESASQIVSRAMFYRALELPEDWLERYWRGIQRVGPDDVLRVFRRHLRPDEMTILVVGDPERLGMEALTQFGPVTILEGR